MCYGGLTLVGCQVPTKATLPLSSQMNRQRKYNKKLMDQDKDRESSVYGESSYCKRENRFDLGKN